MSRSRKKNLKWLKGRKGGGEGEGDEKVCKETTT
jgi:hypothetical protein